MKIDVIVRNTAKQHSGLSCGNVGIYRDLLPKLFIYKAVCKSCYIRYCYGAKL